MVGSVKQWSGNSAFFIQCLLAALPTANSRIRNSSFLLNVLPRTQTNKRMAINLLDIAKGYLTDAVISRVSNLVGESPEGTQKALTGALPVVLNNLIAHGHTPEGPGFLVNLLQPFTQSTATPPTADLIDDDSPERHLQRGPDLTNELFGPDSRRVSEALAQYAGVRPAAAPGLLGLATSLMASLLGRHLLSSQGGVSSAGVSNLLADQRESVGANLPPGLATLLPNVPEPGSSAGAAPAAADKACAVRTPPPTPAYKDSLHDERGGFRLWPWLLALLGAALLYYVVRGCGDNPTDTGSGSGAADTTAAMMPDATATADSAASTMEATTDTATATVRNAAETLGSALTSTAASLGTFGPKKLPDGVELNLPANGVENKLIAFIEDQTKPVDNDTWFDFDRLTFETGSARLRPESREQLQNIAAILKAYPAVNLKIGGYTDNTGNAASNKALSQSRAEAAMRELTTLGVSASRLEAEGYGQQHPVAPNTTEAGRAQNRRTAMRVTKK